MKKTLNYLIVILLLISCSTQKIISPKNIPAIEANSEVASLRAGNNYWKNVWTINPKINPDIWYVKPKNNQPIKATFITDIDSISFDVSKDETYDFMIKLKNGSMARTQIKGARDAAYFSKEYQDENRNKTIVEIPEVYELLNVVFALTSIAEEKEGEVVMNDVPYIEQVNKWFVPYKNHKCVLKVDSILRKKFLMYFGLKMDAYIYEFKGENIVSKGIYNNLAYQVGESQISDELIKDLEDFSEASNFKTFFKEQSTLYESQINYYQNEINIGNMQNWLNRNFPNTKYDCFKVIFSPLVSWNQSARWLENNGFKEAQAHVNFPYPSKKDKERTKQEIAFRDGQILFTEFNHAFINPEAEVYHNTEIFKTAFSDYSFWAVENGIAESNYGNPQAMFNEMMNWSLVSLYLLDNLPYDIANKLIKDNEEWQTTQRGFKYFKAFNQNLVSIYNGRTKGQVVADLYPNILEWAKNFRHEQSSKN